MSEPTGVWWDWTLWSYGWTCPRCQHGGVNHQSAESARFSFAAHFCPRHLETVGAPNPPPDTP